jgi:hypothetical protein
MKHYTTLATAYVDYNRNHYAIECDIYYCQKEDGSLSYFFHTVEGVEEIYKSLIIEDEALIEKLSKRIPASFFNESIEGDFNTYHAQGE